MSQTKEEVATRPPFKEIYEPMARRYQTTVTLMLQGKPVLSKYAGDVLRAVSAFTGRDYSLETVAVKTIEEVVSENE